jgi:acetolactate synthase-1/2/3 large subunit
LQRVGANKAGSKAQAQLDLSNPGLDFVRMGESMGVPSVRVSTAEAFTSALEKAFATSGPHLIEAVVPSAIAGLKLRLLPFLLRSLGKLPHPVASAIKRGVAP